MEREEVVDKIIEAGLRPCSLQVRRRLALLRFPFWEKDGHPKPSLGQTIKRVASPLPGWELVRAGSNNVVHVHILHLVIEGS